MRHAGSAGPRANHCDVLLEICVAALLCTLGVWLIADVTQRVMRRLGVDRVVALLWLGLAERPIEPRTPRRLSELLTDPPRGALG